MELLLRDCTAAERPRSYFPPASASPRVSALRRAKILHHRQPREGALDELEGFELEGSRAFYRPVGPVSFAQAVAMVRAAIAAARSSGAADLLIDGTGLTGFSPPSTPKRFFAVEEWADEARGVAMPVALVVRAEMIHPEKFGVTVAANRGLASEIFASEPEARAWLDARLR